MSDLYEISQDTADLELCPVWVREYGDALDPESFGYVACGTTLRLKYTRTIIGDDYGEIPQYGVYFDCGHSLSQMEEALKQAEYI